jgi:N-hydroxyarylamine O-acetyltransferase
MDVEAYLRRIYYDGPRDSSASSLRKLHRQHLYTVPFENLDIALGVPIRLDLAALFEKIIIRKRGGFCYELNGLFCALLNALGFRVEMLSARVRSADGSFSREFDHMLLKVSLEDGCWIADVGFGDSSLDPVRMRPEDAQMEDAPQFAVLAADRAWDLVRQQSDGSYVPDYRFTETRRRLGDFAGMCQFHQTSPESHFTQNRVCTKALPNGRITVSGMRLIETRDGVRRESMLNSQEELQSCLSMQFGIELADDIDWSRLMR